MAWFGQKSPAFGLDLSSGAIKFVQLRRTSRGLTLDAAGELSLPQDIIVDGDIADPAALSQKITEALHPFDRLLSPQVVAALPEAKTFFQTITVPKADGLKLHDAIQAALPANLPINTEGASIDTQVVKEDGRQWLVTVGAAERSVVDRYLQVLEFSHLVPLVLDIEAAAVMRAVMRQRQSAVGALAILDVGQRHAAMTFVVEGIVQFTTQLPPIGELLTTSIVDSLHISVQEAEDMKRACSLHPDTCTPELKSILANINEDLAKKIFEAETYYNNHFSNATALTELVASGGSAALLAIDDAITSKTKLQLSIVDPWQHIRMSRHRAPTSSHSYTTAIGLALRALDA